MQNEVVILLNEQVINSLQLAYLYLEMSEHYTKKKQSGFSNWCCVQAQWARDRTTMIRSHLRSVDQSSFLQSCSTLKYSSGLDTASPLTKLCECEAGVTAALSRALQLSQTTADNDTARFLTALLHEQSSREAQVGALAERYQTSLRDSDAMQQLDNELTQARYQAPESISA